MRTLRQRPALSTPQCPRVSRRPSVRAHFPYRPPRKGTPHPAAIRPARNPSLSIRALSPFPRNSGMSPLTFAADLDAVADLEQHRIHVARLAHAFTTGLALRTHDLGQQHVVGGDDSAGREFGMHEL